MRFLFNPLEQFTIIPFFPIFLKFNLLGLNFYFDFSLTIFLIENLNNFIIIFFLSMFYLYYTNQKILFNNKIFIKLYSFLYRLLDQQVKEKKVTEKYFILITSLFIFILVNNLIGLIPYGFVSTAQLGQNFFLTSSLIIYFTLLGFFFLKYEFFNLFIPTAPKYMIPFLVIIELISYIARAFSLAIRLFANLMSGHTLLFILCSFNSVILLNNFFAFIVASIVILLIFGLELVIALMQAYVFVVLSSVYIKDSTVISSH